ncbi:acyltransferase [Streptomyces sp. NBC_00237]|uniref:acyltransferase family protein n=1 Tax=Streptomyces sp. NBC_00237 TaxID=2975687 RepID=UPI00225984C6|nr:acyltransferase [Streptomyces sp. NBC_00237]MCX5207298.1 acyltransferase [Streptomyces sp. NBC_00237]
MYALDGLRLVAALMVVAFHFVGFDNWPLPVWGGSTSVVFPRAHPVASYGWLGVQLFFLISGFVICMSCWGRTVREFAVSRVVRLFPAYWFAVLVTAGVLLVAQGAVRTGITPSRILSNLTMFQAPMGARNVAPVYWTLWAEMRFYLLFAVVCALGMTYRRCVGFCGGWLLAAVLAPHADIPLVRMLAVPDAAPFFVGGMVIFLMHRFGTSPVLWLLLGGSWLSAQHQLLRLLPVAERSVDGDLSWSVSLVVVTGFYGVLLLVALRPLRALNRPWLVTAGALTYPLYLLHEEIGWEVIRHFSAEVSPRVLLVGVVGGLVVLAYGVHRTVERPGAKALRRWLGGAGPRRHGTA